MKSEVVKSLSFLELTKREIESLIEIPKDSDMGDYAFPCFVLAKSMKRNPADIAKEIASKVKKNKFERVVASGAYVNFFVEKGELAVNILKDIEKMKDKYGSKDSGKRKKVIIEMSSPNIAKPFGIGHLRSTIIGNSLSRISEYNGYKAIKINYLGDWGTQFGKLIVGYKRFGKESELKKDAIKHLLDIYIKSNKEDYEEEARDWFRKLETGDEESMRLWKRFRELSLKEFEKIYDEIGIDFDVISGESLYNKKMENVVKELEKKKLLKESEGAMIVDLERYGLGVALIKKKDGATLYITRDLAAAIERYEKYKFEKMIYEVGSEQRLHFKQLFKILELLGHSWAGKCVHVEHGLYLDKDRKKFATRKGKVIFMEDVLSDTLNLAKKEISKREELDEKELEARARKIAIAAIFYGDMKNYRGVDAIFDIKKFLSFEGNTGPYLLYSYARARSILRKADYKGEKTSILEIDNDEKKLISMLGQFPGIVKNAYESLAPNLIANYSYELAREFNEFYHKAQVIGSEKESFRLGLVNAFSQVLKNALNLLGIEVMEEM